MSMTRRRRGTQTSQTTAATARACRHEKELKDQQAAAAASAQAAAEEAAAQHKQQMEQLHAALEEQGAAAAAQVAAMQQQAGQLQERLTSVSQQLLSVLQLPQGLIQQQHQHQQYQVMSVGGIVNATAGTPGSPQHAHSPGAAARLSMSPNAQQQQQQQQGLQQGLQQGSAAAPLLQEAVQLSSALSSSLTSNPNTSPEEAAGAVQVLVLGLGQQLQAFAEQLVLLQQENQQLQEDGIALAGDFEACATNLQSLVATVAFSIPVGEEVQQGLNSRDAAVFDETLAALHEVRGASLCIELLCCCSYMLLCTAGLPDACSFRCMFLHGSLGT
jgi:hypothetical protein